MTSRSPIGRKISNAILEGFSWFAVAAAILAMLCIIGTVVLKGGHAISLDFLLHRSAPYGVDDGGIANAILGTLAITLGASILAIPTAILAGIFLTEFNVDSRILAALRFAANVMMGMPSVLVGLFIYMALVVPTGHFSGFAGSVALALLMFPVILRTTEDILNMVPNTLRESALALGMSRTRATLSIVCRSAKNGLLTGVLLSVARVSGETAPLLFTALFADSWISSYFTAPTPSLPVLITEYTTNSPFAAMHLQGWGAALVVMSLVLLLNLSARFLFKEK
jgi:phosphate transport system permease protein